MVWLGIVFSINAERHLAKAEGSKCKERGITQPLKRERRGPERSGGLHGTQPGSPAGVLYPLGWWSGGSLGRLLARAWRLAS